MEREYKIEYLGAGPGLEYHILVDVKEDMPMHSFEGLLNFYFGRGGWKDEEKIYLSLRKSSRAKNLLRTWLEKVGVI